MRIPMKQSGGKSMSFILARANCGESGKQQKIFYECLWCEKFIFKQPSSSRSSILWASKDESHIIVKKIKWNKEDSLP